MSSPAWRLLTTLTDLPTAQLLAQILGEEGIAVRVMSDAGVLGQAAPSRLYVEDAHYARARRSLAQRHLSDAELEELAAVASAADRP
jgi:hypothetical protein